MYLVERFVSAEGGRYFIALWLPPSLEEVSIVSLVVDKKNMVVIFSHRWDLLVDHISNETDTTNKMPNGSRKICSIGAVPVLTAGRTRHRTRR